jgi:hypothetical protein
MCLAVLAAIPMLAAAWSIAAQPESKPAPGKDKDAEKERLKREGKGLFDHPQTPPGGGDEPNAGPKGWAVVIAAFRGDGRDQAAAALLSKVRSEGGLPEAYTAHRNEAVIVAVGDFPSPDDDRARKELARIQQLEIGGVKPYAGAMLAPPLEWKMAGGMPQFNLARARQIYGDRAMYTLQVGVYGRMDLKGVPTEADLAEARKAAEQAAARLRQEGELAFYYHGPTMSMVTVGVFDTNDFDPQIAGFKSIRLRDTQKRNPYNLYNGEGMRVKVKGQNAQLQPSNLVEVPKK